MGKEDFIFLTLKNAAASGAHQVRVHKYTIAAYGPTFGLAAKQENTSTFGINTMEVTGSWMSTLGHQLEFTETPDQIDALLFG